MSHLSIAHLVADNDLVIICGMSESVTKVIYDIGVNELLPENQIIKTRIEALRLAEEILKR